MWSSCCYYRQVWSYVKDIKAVIYMVIVQITFAAVNILYKLAAQDGMNLRILIAYRFLFATASILPLAFFLERKIRPKLTWTVLGYAFLTGLFGGSLVQNLYLESIVLTSATFTSALGNLVPAVTFILGVLVRIEKLSIKTWSGKAKIFGTLLGISGATVLTFYKGVEIKLWPVHKHLLQTNHNAVASYSHHHELIGALLATSGCVSYAVWLIIQTKMSQRYPCYYSSTALMCVMGSIQSFVFAASVERDWNEWKLGWNIRLLAVAFTGIVGTGMVVSLIAWCVRLRGPLFVSVFNPLMVVIVAFAASLILHEKLYIGSVLGGFLIILGLYGVIWGKGKELEKMRLKTVLYVPSKSPKKGTDDIEMVTNTSTGDEESGANKSVLKLEETEIGTAK